MYRKPFAGASVAAHSGREVAAAESRSGDLHRNSPPPQSSLAQSIPILLVETNSLLREGLNSLLLQTRFRVVATGLSLDAVPAALEATPKIVLIGADNVAVITSLLEKCNARYPSAWRVVLHECSGDQLITILRAGAHACLGRSVTTEALLMTLDLAMQGVTVISSPLGFAADASLDRRSQPIEITTGASKSLDSIEGSHKLSVREVAILECLVHGDSNKLIARKFQIAEATVKVHVKAILRKIRAANRTQAAIWAVNHLSSARAQPRQQPAV